jgi:hypothetical protein
MVRLTDKEKKIIRIFLIREKLNSFYREFFLKINYIRFSISLNIFKNVINSVNIKRDISTYIKYFKNPIY